MLFVAVILFAFSTMVSWSYYGQQATAYMFGPLEGGRPHLQADLLRVRRLRRRGDARQRAPDSATR
jgi:Na+/alanine symporter